MYTPPPKKRRDRSYDREYKQSHISNRSSFKDKEYREKDYREKDYHREKDFRDKEYREKDFREKEYREKDYREREFREKHYDGYSTKRYSRTPSPPMSHRRSSSKSHKRFYSPLADRNRNSKIHSRSKSPRTSRMLSPMHLNKNNRQRSRSRSMSPRSSSLRKIDYKEKISDTSLFAELVKDKHKRDKALAEIVNQNEANELLLNSGPPVNDSGENSLSNENYIISSIDVIDSTATPPVSNGINNESESNCMEIVDIPMPDAFTTTIEQSTNNLEVISSTTATTINSLGTEIISTQIPTIGDEAPIPTVINSVTTTEIKKCFISQPPQPPLPPPPSNDLNNLKNKIQTNNKPKSLTKLPMPPGVNVNDLEDVQSPSPPQNNSPLPKISQHRLIKALPQIVPTKKGLLNLPMPPVIPGSEDLSGDEDIGSPPRTSKLATPTTLTKRNRPRILNRRSSRTEFKEWGERCVDVFEVIAQIGEGTYGQVSLSTRKLSPVF